MPDIQQTSTAEAKTSQRMPADLHKKLKILAIERGTTLNQLVVDFLEEGVKRLEEQEKAA